jgi:hypothetical protein
MQWLEDELPKEQCVEVVRELERLWRGEEQTRQQSDELWRRIIAATYTRDGGARDPRWHPRESATESKSRCRSRPQQKRPTRSAGQG